MHQLNPVECRIVAGGHARQPLERPVQESVHDISDWTWDWPDCPVPPIDFDRRWTSEQARRVVYSYCP